VGINDKKENSDSRDNTLVIMTLDRGIYQSKSHFQAVNNCGVYRISTVIAERNFSVLSHLGEGIHTLSTINHEYITRILISAHSPPLNGSNEITIGIG